MIPIKSSVGSGVSLRLVFIALLIGVLPGLSGAPATPEMLAEEIDSALVARDVSALVKLVYTEGMSAEDMKRAEPGLVGLIPVEGKAVVKAEQIPSTIDLGAPVVYKGKRIELNAPPAGVIRVSAQQGRAQIQSTLIYVKTKEGYLLAGHKSTDLGWKGPEDGQLGFRFSDEFPSGDLDITIKYNASGVELVDKPEYASVVLLGQHIDEITIKGLPKGFKGRILLTKDGKEIYRSEVITTSDFTYRRSLK